MFEIVPTKKFTKELQKIIKNNSILKQKIFEVFQDLQDNPHKPKLGSHKVNLSKFGEVWASKVTPDIRIIWDYNSDNQIEIILFTIGGHDKVYI
jgi:mRNA-degrading endonuclease YafQ of YafQ-DinJ toxin-antitoxin module